MRHKKGIITAIHGPMFSGKTEELLRQIRRARIAGKTVQLFKPVKDNRYHAEKIVPHSMASKSGREGFGETAIAVDSSYTIMQKINPSVNLVAIEEAQFFDEHLIDAVRILSDRGIDVVMSLLDQDYRRRPFPISENLSSGDIIASSHLSTKLSAICVQCGSDAQHSQKLTLTGEYPTGEPIYVPASFQGDTVEVGTGRELNFRKKHPPFIYEARCLDCHEVPDMPVLQIQDYRMQNKETTG